MRRVLLPFVCLTIALGAGCTVSPQNGQHLTATDQPLTFSGFTAVPGQRVHVQAQDCDTGAWTTLATTVAGRRAFPLCSTNVYWWESPVVVLPQQDASWCHLYGAIWKQTRVVDDAGQPLLSIGRPYQSGCEVTNPCDPTLVQRCANAEGIMMLLCTEEGGGCLDRLR